VLRKVNETDWVWVQALPGGFLESDIYFYFTDAGCAGPRMFFVTNMTGIAYAGVPHSGQLFYTTKIDPNGASPTEYLRAFEMYPAGTPVPPAVDPARCTPMDFGQQSAGAVKVGDPAFSTLTAPFHIK
jgi:hypothetical protein